MSDTSRRLVKREIRLVFLALPARKVTATCLWGTKYADEGFSVTNTTVYRKEGHDGKRETK